MKEDVCIGRCIGFNYKLSKDKLKKMVDRSLDGSREHERLEAPSLLAPRAWDDGGFTASKEPLQSMQRAGILHVTESWCATNLLNVQSAWAARIADNSLNMTSVEGVTVGPFLLGAAMTVHTLTPALTMCRR
ncbi:hypothetical protein [Caballeronia calidae]|uniref:hypothetical protein n=1 Tax=Caballeronia calidae TaxID=1777139 RepID=UPI000789975A|nr:hypothetical protein [Caballeronia calidae]